MLRLDLKTITVIIPLSIIIGGALIGCGSRYVKQHLGARDQYEYAMNLYKKEKYYQAAIEFQKFVYSFPGNNEVDTAQYYLGMCYYKDEDYALGAGEFKKILTSFPASEFADDAQYRLAMCHYYQSPKYSLDQTDTYIAIDEFLNFIDNFPASEYQDSAVIYLKELRNKLARKALANGRLYQGLNKYESAIVYYDMLLDRYPESPYAADALYRKGECLLVLEKYMEAREVFLEYLDRYQDHKFHDKTISILRDLENMPKAEK